MVGAGAGINPAVGKVRKTASAVLLPTIGDRRLACCRHRKNGHPGARANGGRGDRLRGNNRVGTFFSHCKLAHRSQARHRVVGRRKGCRVSRVDHSIAFHDAIVGARVEGCAVEGDVITVMGRTRLADDPVAARLHGISCREGPSDGGFGLPDRNGAGCIESGIGQHNRPVVPGFPDREHQGASRVENARQKAIDMTVGACCRDGPVHTDR